MNVSQKVLAAAVSFAVMATAGAANAAVVFSNVTESTFTVSGPGNNAFCSGNTCDFLGGAGGNGTNSVNAPLISNTASSSGLPVVATGSPTIIGQTNTHVLEWWTVGNYNTSSVTQGTLNQHGISFTTPTVVSGTQPLFSNTSFFPPGGNDHSSFLTAEFTGKVTVGTGNTLSFTGSVDDNILIYVRTDGTTNPFTLLAVSPTNLSNQPAFDFTSALLGAGIYDFEVFYADRSSTDASLVLDATVTAPVPEPSTWAMMILGFLGLGYVGYRRRTTFAAKGV
jgi:hypothetical protein